MSGGPLKDIRVLDLSRILAGPWATQMLADMGAEVIKIERPDTGDDTRLWGPPFVQNQDGSRGDAAYFHCANRGKKSVSVDITTKDGQNVVKRLARHSHILVENFKTGGLAKYGLDYDSLATINPALVYCSITGFGQTGPYADRPGYDLLLQAMGGMMSITGDPDSAPGGHPLRVGVAVSDLMTGMYAASAILGALHHATRTGEGQHIDLALLDTTAAMLANQTMNYLIGGMVPGRMGNAHPNIVPYQDFKTADGYLILAIGNDAQFDRFCTAADCTDLWEDEPNRTNEGRVANRDTIITRITEALVTRPTADWIARFEAANVPAGPINTIADVFADPQIVDRGLKLTLPHGAAGTLPSVANPVRYSKTPMHYRAAGPVLSEHTQEILDWLEDVEANRPPHKPGSAPKP